MTTTQEMPTSVAGNPGQGSALVEDLIDALDEGIALFDDEGRFLLCNVKYMELLAPPGHPKPIPGTSSRQVARVFSGTGYLQPTDGKGDTTFSSCVGVPSEPGQTLEFRNADGHTITATTKTTGCGRTMVSVRLSREAQTPDQSARDMLLDAFQALDEGLVLCDENMRFVFANTAWKEMMYGARPHLTPKPGDDVADKVIELVREGFYDIPEDQSHEDYINWLMTEMSQHGKQVEIRTAEGKHYVGASHLTAYGGSLLFVRDLTNQRRAEATRLEAVNGAIDAVDYPLVLFDADEKFVLANKAWYAMIEPTGIKPQPGAPGSEFFWSIVESDYYLRPEGMSKEDYYAAGMALIYNYGREFPLQTTDGRIFLGSSNVTALGGFLLSYREITDQVRAEAELEQQREVAHQNEKLSALGELLAGVAHELNNPLSVIFGYSQMLQGKVSDPVLSERIDLMCQSAERAGKIVKTFLAMARQRPTRIDICSLNDVVATALEVSGYSLKTNGTVVETELDETAPPISGDFDQLAQVFSNLIVNAGHALQDQREDGRILVRSYHDADENRTVVEIRDNGPGIPADIQNRVFEPFFTTKEVGEGTGVGLAFSHKIIEGHEGELSLRSAPGEGTSFYVKLDSVADDNTQNELDRLAPRPSKALSCLVVDDEAGVARLLSDLLTDEGHSVEMTTTPRQALHMAEAREFDIILSDFKMPDMDGEAFYEALRLISPRNADRVGFITGDALSENVRDFFARSKRPFIEKPIIKRELLTLIRLVLYELE
ncbi:hybrid sensor histidine kinase/response regulator [Ruegeria atlantica]|uniref:hybrid sensor histidine kinase/response regulator n=1 Tax=Ruegeria atlantica TaxID=81569 RepID=UPI00147F8C8A|nr:ATP-binding protein [Ruegeria atlantica]